MLLKATNILIRESEEEVLRWLSPYSFIWLLAASHTRNGWVAIVDLEEVLNYEVLGGLAKKTGKKFYVARINENKGIGQFEAYDKNGLVFHEAAISKSFENTDELEDEFYDPDEEDELEEPLTFIEQKFKEYEIPGSIHTTEGVKSGKEGEWTILS